MSMIEKQFGSRPPLHLLFRAATIQGLADHLRKEMAKQPEAGPAPASTPAAPLVVQSWKSWKAGKAP